MSISRALGTEKPAAKRPRSCMGGPCGRKLSIMSTVLPNTPSQKSKEQLGVRKADQHQHEKSQPPNALEATWKDPVAEKQTAKSRRKRIWKDASRSCIPQEAGGARARARAPPPSSQCPLRVRDSFYISIYIYLPIPLYSFYIYIHIPLSLFLSRSSFW